MNDTTAVKFEREYNVLTEWKKEFAVGNLVKAAEILETALLKDPDNYQYLYHLGLTYRTTTKFDKAISFYHKALKIYPDFYLANLGIGVVYQQTGELDKAITYLEKAVSDPKAPTDAINSLGLTYKMNGDLETAIEMYNIAINNLFGEIYDNLSENRVRKVVAMESEYPNQWFKLARGIVIRKSKEEGLTAVSLPTPSTVSKFYRDTKESTCWIDNGKERKVMPQYFNEVQKTLRSDVSYSILTNNLGAAFTELGSIKNATKWYRESIAFVPEGVDYQDSKLALDELEEYSN